MARKSEHDECQEAHRAFKDGVQDVEGAVVTGEQLRKTDDFPIMSDDITYNPKPKRKAY